VILRDVTERERSRAELLRSNHDLRQFAFAASHDLRAPLRSISGYLGMLQARFASTIDEAARDLIERALAAVKQVDRLTDDLLTYARADAEATPAVDTDSNAALAESLRLLEAPIADSGARIDSADLPVLRTDPRALVRLFQNLLDNAIKYRGEQPLAILVRAERAPSQWIFSVSDNGIGVEPEYRERIFGLLQRLHTQRAYPGTGMGLALCRRIVERLGGTIWVQSNAGGGSTFCFSIPEPAAS
jgi:light-regulated signal transduction histidine kinase (bacteriophytochrome)